MLESLFWFIAFPFVLTFILGFLSYGISEIANSSNKESGKATNSLSS